MNRSGFLKCSKSQARKVSRSTIWNVLNSSKHQKHYANDEDELERYGFFKKSKTRVTKHDDQSKAHHHQRANLDHCEVDAWWFDPC